MRFASFSRLGSPPCGKRSASTSGAMPVTKSCAIKPVANTQRPAFTPRANLILPAPSSTGRRGSTADETFLSGMVCSLLDHPNFGTRTALREAVPCTLDRRFNEEGLRALA